MRSRIYMISAIKGLKKMNGYCVLTLRNDERTDDWINKS